MTQNLGAALRMISAMAAIGILLPTSRAVAAKIDITPSISLDQAYDSNVFNTNGNEKKDFILRVTPAVNVSFRMPETTLNLSSSISSDTYYKYTGLSNTNSAIALGIDATPIRITPRFSIAPSGHFVEAQNSFRRTQLLPSGDPMIPPSIASETATQKNRDYGAALRTWYLVTPKTDFTLGGGFAKRQYLGTPTGGDVDSRVVMGDSTLMYKFTPLFSSGLFFSTAYNTFDNGVNSRVFAGGLAGSYQFTPSVTMNVRAGASRMEDSAQAGFPDRTTWSPAGLLSLVYAESAIRASLTGSMDQSGGGSFGFTTRRQTVGLFFTDHFTREWTADLSGTIEKNKSLDPAVPGDVSTAAGTAGIGYQAVPWAMIRLSGTALRQSAGGGFGSDLNRYSAFLGITLGKMYNIY